MNKTLMTLFGLAGRANFWPVIAILFVMLFYFLGSTGVPWYIYLVVSLIAIERAYLQLRIVIGNWIREQAMKEMRQQIGTALSGLSPQSMTMMSPPGDESD